MKYALALTCVAMWSVGAVGQTAATSSVTATSTVKVQIMSPDTPVAINGRIYRVADLISAIPALSSSTEQRLRNQVMPNRGKTEQAAPSLPPNQSISDSATSTSVAVPTP